MRAARYRMTSSNASVANASRAGDDFDHAARLARYYVVWVPILLCIAAIAICALGVVLISGRHVRQWNHVCALPKMLIQGIYSDLSLVQLTYSSVWADLLALCTQTLNIILNSFFYHVLGIEVSSLA